MSRRALTIGVAEFVAEEGAAERYVPLPVVARAIHQEVNRRRAACDGYEQRVTASVIDMSVDPDLPFFPNPAHTDDARVRLRSRLDAAVTPFLDDLDESLDARHFLERAAGMGRLAERTGPLVGCFTGRDAELRRISPWLNGIGSGSLAVVTGSAGVGKSALLGVLVCAAHRELRTPTRPVWDRVAQAPLLIKPLAAVHARGRGLSAVVASVARQLGIPEPGGAAALVAAIRSLPAPPVVVLDALDEAERPAEIAAELLRPLAELPPVAGREAVRLLVGVRNYPEYAGLLDLARGAGLLVDLDEVPTEVLEDNLNAYVLELLRATSYRSRHAVSGAFAGQVAEALAAAATGPGERWGPFLVAGLYTRHFIATHRDRPLDDHAAAGQLGRQVPHDLPGVFELDLRAQPDQPWLLPVVSLLAHARGQGVPVSVITRAAAAFAPDRPAPSGAEIRAALDAGKFYLRQSIDTDRTTLYRLFHQGLVDHLRARTVRTGPDPSDPVYGRLLDALLDPLGPADGRDWAAAEPYLLRHALEHAEDAGRTAELLTDPTLLLHLSAVGVPDSAAAQSSPELRLARALHGAGDPPTRDLLALEAARAGLTTLADRAANPAGQPPLPWQPRWTAGGADPASHPPRDSRPASQPTVRDLTRFRGRGHPVAAVSADGSRILWSGGDVRGWLQVVDLNDTWTVAWHRAGRVIDAALSADGQVIAFATPRRVFWRNLSNGQTEVVFRRLFPSSRIRIAMSADGSRIGWVRHDADGHRWLRVWERMGQTASFHLAAAGPVWSVAVGAQVWVAGVSLGRVALWRQDGAGVQHVWSYPLHMFGDPEARCVAVSPDGRRVAAGGSDGMLRLWDGTTGRLLNRYDGGDGPATAIALSADGRYAALGGTSAGLLLWDTESHELLATGDGSDPAVGVAITADGRHVLSLTRAGAVTHWHQTFTTLPATPATEPPAPPAIPRPGHIHSLAVVRSRGMIAVGDDDGDVHLRSLPTGERMRPSVHSPGRPAEVWTQLVGGHDVVVFRHDDADPELLDPVSGKSLKGVARWPGLISAAQARAARRAVRGVSGEIHLVTYAGNQVLLAPAGQVLGEHDGPVTALTAALLDTRPVAFSGGQDGTVRVWDLAERRLLDVIHLGRPVTALDATDSGDLLVAAGGELIAFRHAGSARREATP